jgi:hypothetical protein
MLLGDDMIHRPVLSDEERAQYIRHGLGLKIIQTTTDVKPYNSGTYVTRHNDRAIFEAIRQREGKHPSLISSKRAIEQYEEDGTLLSVDNHAYYYDIKGMNDFEHVRLGIVAGSPEPSSQTLQLWGALAGTSVESNGEKGWDRTYGDFGDRLLLGMRENEVLQAVMRFGRSVKDGERGATVYVHTGALPEWVPVTPAYADVHLWDNGETNGMGQVLAAIGSKDEWRTPEIANHPVVSISNRQVRRNLKTLRDYGYIDGKNEGPGIGYRWWDIRVIEATPYGQVEFGS